LIPQIDRATSWPNGYTKEGEQMRIFPCLFAAALAVIASQPVPAVAATLFPSSYDMPNGERGAFDYYDESYSGEGNLTTGLSALTGGKGDLTDGVIPESGWNVDSAPFVGWVSVSPTIRFHWEETAKVEGVTFHFYDSEGAGGVSAPLAVRLSNGTETVVHPINDSPASGRSVVVVDGLDLQGDFLDATIEKADGWIMLSEVTFEGQFVPEPTTGLLGAIAVALLLIRRRQLA
jgi:hypothetical protein